MKMQLSVIEQEVMTKLLEGPDPVLNVLRRQLESCKVSKREFTGVGFFTTFSVPQDVERVSAQKTTFKFGDVKADIRGLQFGAGFLLYVKNGAIEMLEAYTYDEKWPKKVEDFKVEYISGNKRNLAEIRRAWQNTPEEKRGRKKDIH